MDYSEKGRVKREIISELEQVKRRLEDSPTLKERVLGVEYPIISIEEDRISMLYSTKKSRREHHGTPRIGQIELRRIEDGELGLSGVVSYMGRASELFERSVHRVAHEFNVPLYFNLSR